MKTKLFLPLLAALAVGPASLQAQTAFTYQGKLVDDCCPATGYYDLFFSVWDGPTGPTQLPAGNPHGLSLVAVPVTNGLFTVKLDFGTATASIFAGPRRWLAIDVRTNNVGAYVTLSPRTELTPTPYALFAQKAGMVSNDSITAPNISAGQVVKSLNGLKDVINLVAGANVTIAPNGNNLTINSTGDGAFSLNGNNAYYNAGNVGIGTAQPRSALDVVGGILWGPNGLSTDQGGSIELGDSLLSATAPYFDFHYGVGAAQDFNVRLINSGNGALSVISKPLSLASSVEVARFSASGLGVNGGINVDAPNATLNLVSHQATYGSVLTLRNYVTSITPNTYLGSINFENGTGTPGQIAYLGNNTMHFRVGDAERMLINNAGQVMASGGFTAPWGPILAVPGGPNTRLLTMRWDGVDNVDSEVPGATANNARFSFAANGNLSVSSLTIRGGADLAEPFQMSEGRIPEGSVVVIDEENPGHLKHATHAYDTRVAGIVSGANGVKAGIALHQEGVIEGGQNVALTGRVYVKVDASFGAIKPGDLLTTSDTPGHAMKVTDRDRAQGAILGKAMTALADGQGLVLVLVSLQ